MRGDPALASGTIRDARPGRHGLVYLEHTARRARQARGHRSRVTRWRPDRRVGKRPLAPSPLCDRALGTTTNPVYSSSHRRTTRRAPARPTIRIAILGDVVVNHSHLHDTHRLTVRLHPLRILEGQRSANRSRNKTKPMLLKTLRTAWSRPHRRSRTIAALPPGSSDGSRSCLFVGRITVSVKGTTVPRSMAPSRTQPSSRSHADHTPIAQPTVASDARITVPRRELGTNSRSASSLPHETRAGCSTAMRRSRRRRRGRRIQLR